MLKKRKEITSSHSSRSKTSSSSFMKPFLSFPLIVVFLSFESLVWNPFPCHFRETQFSITHWFFIYVCLFLLYQSLLRVQTVLYFLPTASHTHTLTLTTALNKAKRGELILCFNLTRPQGSRYLPNHYSGEGVSGWH